MASDMSTSAKAVLEERFEELSVRYEEEMERASMTATQDERSDLNFTITRLHEVGKMIKAIEELTA